MTITRNEFMDIVVSTGVLNPEYALDVLVRMAHHSSAIEGNTLTLSDTITVLADDMTPNRSTNLRELYEVANHREAMADVLNQIADNKPIDSQFVKLLQYDLVDHIREDGGQFKTTQNAIMGASFTPATPGNTPFLIEQWLDNTNWQIANLESDTLVETMASQHIEFEKIHPFPDGNGRTGRMLMMYESLKYFGVPVIIKVDQRADYIQLLQDENVDGLSDLFIQSILEEQDRVVQFDTQIEQDGPSL